MSATVPDWARREAARVPTRYERDQMRRARRKAGVVLPGSPAIMAPIPVERTCAYEPCSRPYTPKPKQGRQQRYCSPVCRNAAYNAEHGPTHRRLGLASGTVGAVSEMAAAVNLMTRGYEVFRALSPACSCDLIALDASGKPLRIEVRTGYRSPVSGKIIFPRNGTTVRKRGEDVLDHYAVVILHDDGPEIVYEPPLSGGAA